MAKTIDILCVIDANFLMSQVAAGNLSAGSIDQPTNLGAWQNSDTYIFLICDGESADNNQGRSELTVNASVGDTIRWSITDPSLGLIPDSATQSYSSMLYEYHLLEGPGVMTNPLLSVVPTEAFINQTRNPAAAMRTSYVSASWLSEVQAVGNVTYNWDFQAIDNYTGETVGFFTWDPFVHVS